MLGIQQGEEGPRHTPHSEAYLECCSDAPVTGCANTVLLGGLSPFLCLYLGCLRKEGMKLTGYLLLCGAELFSPYLYYK